MRVKKLHEEIMYAPELNEKISKILIAQERCVNNEPSSRSLITDFNK